MLDRKVIITILIAGLIKKIWLYKRRYYPKPFTNKNEIEVELDLCHYALKAQQAFVHCKLLNKMI